MWPAARAAMAQSSASVTACVTPLSGDRSTRSHRLRSQTAARQGLHTSAQRSRASAGSSASTHTTSECGSDEKSVLRRWREKNVPLSAGAAASALCSATPQSAGAAAAPARHASAGGAPAEEAMLVVALGRGLGHSQRARPRAASRSSAHAHAARSDVTGGQRCAALRAAAGQQRPVRRGRGGVRKFKKLRDGHKERRAARRAAAASQAGHAA